MTTNAAKELPELGERIEGEIVDDIMGAVDSLARYSPADGENGAIMTFDRWGDYILRDEALDAIRDALR